MRIAFTSCVCTHAFSDQPVWEQISQHNPDYLVLLGDMVYLDANTVPHPIDMNVDAFAHLAHTRYTQLLKQPQFRTLVRKLGPGRVFATWDDHDFLWNDAHGASVRSTPAQADKIDRSTAFHEAFRAALATGLRAGSFPEHYSDPVFWRPSQPPLEVPSLSLGENVSLHLCDVRTFRTPRLFVAKAQRSLLGTAQRNRLAAAIRNTGRETIHLLASATTLHHWRDYPADFEWLCQLAAEHRILVLSGDVHENRTARVGTAGLALHEITSSGAAVCTAITVGDRQQNFGLLDLGGHTLSARFYHFGSPQPALERRYDAAKWEVAVTVPGDRDELPA